MQRATHILPELDGRAGGYHRVGADMDAPHPLPHE